MKRPIFASTVGQELPWHFPWQCMNQSGHTKAEVLNPEASSALQEFLFFSFWWNILANIDLTSFPVMAGCTRVHAHAHTHAHTTCLVRLLESYSESLRVAGKGKRLHGARKRWLKPERYVDRRLIRGQPDGRCSQGSANFGQLGSLSRGLSCWWEPQRKPHFLGSCYHVPSLWVKFLILFIYNSYISQAISY